MKLGSSECVEALKKYKTNNRSEELMVELLLVSDDDNEGFAKMSYKICDELTDEEIENLDILVTKIRKELNIED